MSGKKTCSQTGLLFIEKELQLQAAQVRSKTGDYKQSKREEAVICLIVFVMTNLNLLLSKALNTYLQVGNFAQVLCSTAGTSISHFHDALFHLHMELVERVRKFMDLLRSGCASSYCSEILNILQKAAPTPIADKK